MHPAIFIAKVLIAFSKEMSPCKYLQFSALYRFFNHITKINVLSVVLHRGGMVQTAEQYIFIHRALRDFEASLPALEPPARPAAN